MVGKIVIEELIEHEDGSATITFECDEDARQALISEGILSLLTKAVDEHNKDYNWKKGEQTDED